MVLSSLLGPTDCCSKCTTNSAALACYVNTLVSSFKNDFKFSLWCLERCSHITEWTNRTLHDYSHYIKPGIVVQLEVTKQLMKEVKIETLKEWQKQVAVVFDEMKVKKGIVYDVWQTRICKVIGFVDFGSVHNTRIILVNLIINTL